MEPNTPYELIEGHGGKPIKAWVRGVPFDEKARAQLEMTSRLPFIHKWVAAMPDVHLGIGATVGSVVPTKGAIVPAAVGVDIGCGMCAVRTDLVASDLPDSLAEMRERIEKAVPHGRTHRGGRNDRGSWHQPPDGVKRSWNRLEGGWKHLQETHKGACAQRHPATQLGTLGSGNHFIEVCLDESEQVWFVLHSGSRGAGNRIGMYFIERARREIGEKWGDLPHRDLAWFDEDTELFDDYVEAVSWAQEFAAQNRRVMMENVVNAVSRTKGVRRFKADLLAVNCHHNYVQRETHFGEDVLVTRKGAVRAGLGELGIIPGSMGARSYIVKGKGNPDSFESCSHGAGRAYSRTAAKKQFTLEEHVKATEGVECRKDSGVLDETPAAYKSIDDVMKAQEDLVEVLHTLRQVVCVKG